MLHTLVMLHIEISDAKMDRWLEKTKRKHIDLYLSSPSPPECGAVGWKPHRGNPLAPLDGDLPLLCAHWLFHGLFLIRNLWRHGVRLLAGGAECCRKCWGEAVQTKQTFGGVWFWWAESPQITMSRGSEPAAIGIGVVGDIKKGKKVALITGITGQVTQNLLATPTTPLRGLVKWKRQMSLLIRSPFTLAENHMYLLLPL